MVGFRADVLSVPGTVILPEAVSPEHAEAQYRQRALRQLERKAQQLGARVVMDPAPVPT